jgi:hypothetical protein
MGERPQRHVISTPETMGELPGVAAVAGIPFGSGILTQNSSSGI